MTTLPPGEHLDILLAALAIEADGQRLLLAGDDAAGRAGMREASSRYRDSWEVAPPRSFGRLVGMLKAAIIAGDPSDAAAYAADLVDLETPAAAYAAALVALVRGDDAAATSAAAAMDGAGPAFDRAAEAIRALVARDARRYAAAVDAITADFESRTAHLTGVPIADTALMFERLAGDRHVASGARSPLLPPVPS